jgi:nitric oxide reductase activation protein
VANAGETPLWTEGYFSAILGEVTPIPATIFSGEPMYLRRRRRQRSGDDAAAGGAERAVRDGRGERERRHHADEREHKRHHGHQRLGQVGRADDGPRGRHGTDGSRGSDGAERGDGRGDVLLCLTGAMPALSITPQGTRVHVVARFTLP